MSETDSPRKRVWRKAESYIGETFGRLTILRIAGKSKTGRPVVECQCSCGNIHSTTLEILQSGEGGSCGCYKREQLAKPTHLRTSSTRKRGYPSAEIKRASQIAWVKANPEKVAAIARQFREDNPELVAAEKARYYQKNKKAICDKVMHRFATEPAFRIEMLITSRIRKVLKRQKAVRSSKTFALVGCTLDEFVAHIKSQFIEGMTWELFMRGEIHLITFAPVAYSTC